MWEGQIACWWKGGGEKGKTHAPKILRGGRVGGRGEKARKKEYKQRKRASIVLAGPSSPEERERGP